MAHKNMKDLLHEISLKAKKSLDENVAPIVKDEMRQQVWDEVYNVYEPTQYERTYQFLDERNFMSFSNGDFNFGKHIEQPVYMKVYHFDPRGISDLIVAGQNGARLYGLDMRYNEHFINLTKARWARSGKTDEKGFWYRRDFIDTTRTVIQSREKTVINAFKKGMK